MSWGGGNDQWGGGNSQWGGGNQWNAAPAGGPPRANAPSAAPQMPGVSPPAVGDPNNPMAAMMQMMMMQGGGGMPGAVPPPPTGAPPPGTPANPMAAMAANPMMAMMNPQMMAMMAQQQAMMSGMMGGGAAAQPEDMKNSKGQKVDEKNIVGYVKSWKDDKDFGFVARDDLPGTTFFKGSQLSENMGRAVRKNAPCVFDLIKGSNGKDEAVNLRTKSDFETEKEQELRNVFHVGVVYDGAKNCRAKISTAPTEKGFGFLQVEDGSQYYFHTREVLTEKPLSVGTDVVFDARMNSSMGKLEAYNVKRLDEPNPAGKSVPPEMIDNTGNQLNVRAGQRDVPGSVRRDAGKHVTPHWAINRGAAADYLMAGQKDCSGTVRRMTDKGFGFIAADAGGDIFFHMRSVKATKSLEVGEAVIFDVAARVVGQSTLSSDRRVEAANIRRKGDVNVFPTEQWRGQGQVMEMDNRPRSRSPRRSGRGGGW